MPCVLWQWCTLCCSTSLWWPHVPYIPISGALPSLCFLIPFSLVLIAEKICYGCRRMKLQSAVCVGQSSTSNALGRSVFALVVRPLMAGRLRHLSKLHMVARACHQWSLFSLHLSLHHLGFSLIFSPKQGRISFGGPEIVVLWSLWVLCQICLYELSLCLCSIDCDFAPNKAILYCTVERRFLPVLISKCNKMQCNPALLLLAVFHTTESPSKETEKKCMRCECGLIISWTMHESCVSPHLREEIIQRKG